MAVTPFWVVQKQGSNVACTRWSVAHSDRVQEINLFLQCVLNVLVQCVWKVAVHLGYGRFQLKCDGTQ